MNTRRIRIVLALIISSGFLWLSIWIIDLELDRAWMLRNLLERGLTIEVPRVELKASTGRHSSNSVKYRFLPAGRKDPKDEPPKPTVERDLHDWQQPFNFDHDWRRDLANIPPDPYVYGWDDDWAYRAVRRGGPYIVTYLPEDPEVNVIGPITEDRIRWNWLKNRGWTFHIWTVFAISWLVSEIIGVFRDRQWQADFDRIAHSARTYRTPAPSSRLRRSSIRKQ